MGANQLYKKYKADGGTLGFKEWITREKKKRFVNFDGNAVIPENKSLTDSLQKTLDSIHRKAGLKTDLENKYILGIHRGVWIGLGVALVVTTGVIIYKKTRK